MKAAQAMTRVQVRNILFATDFSRNAEAALPYAADLARRFGARICAVHVRRPDAYQLVPPANWPETLETSDRLAREALQSWLDKYPDVKSDAFILLGDIWPNLEGVIEKREIDLIVVGTHGRTGLGKMVLGSVAEEIVRSAPCPVLTVGPRAKTEPGGKEKFREILFASDFSPASEAAAPFALSLAQEHAANLTLLHVIEAPRAGEIVDPSELVDSSARMLRNLVPEEAELWCKPRFTVEVGPPAEKILEVAGKIGADLIVLGAKHPTAPAGAATHLPFATAHKVITRAACPVLTVRG